ncbi:MAG: hypothetical protein DSY53_02115 [Persephonella sp.]|nr:MAG: hypothetical protein DSY53_02115 [Persephonella sp.]
MKKILVLLGLVFILVLNSCSSSINSYQINPLNKKDSFIVLPFENNTETPLAGLRASKIAEGILVSHGFNINEKIYKQKEYKSEEIKQMLKKFKEEGYRYAVVGTVNEWRYKTGIDGEPAVNITMRIVDLKNGKTVWSGVASKSGMGYSSIGTLAQELLNELAESIK